MSNRDKSDKAPDKSDPDDVVKVQPGEHGAVPLPVEAPTEPAHEQPPAGPAPDLFATWNDPAPLDEDQADEDQADEDQADEDGDGDDA